jgi:DNA (cytosine-5)-methyltransferase 1
VQEHRIDESESLLLRTPQASEASGGTRSKANLENKNHQLMLRDQVKQLFPTPTVSDTFTDNLASSQQSDGSMHSVTLAQIVNRPDLLPTPNTMDMLPARTGEALERTRKRGDMSREHLTTISNLREAVIEMLPTPQVDDSKNNGHNENRRLTLASKVYGETEWGKFAPSIQQWETITGNLAPAPTIPDGKEGQHRLNPAFAEWMMGLPAGWITDCDITRNEQLKACGNGVVPQQATKAITELIKGITI